MGKSNRRQAECKDKDTNCQDQLQVARQVYEEVQRQFRIHDDANVSLEKKAQNLMIASALVATLFATVTVARDAGLQFWAFAEWYAAIVPVSSTVVAIWLCILVNKASDHRVPIKGGGLLCHGELDEKVYEDLVSGEERYYKLRIEEYALALVKMEGTNSAKARKLNYAYAAFAASIALQVPMLIAAIVL